MKSAERLKKDLNKIKPLDKHIYKACRDRWDSIAKPLNGLGQLEEIISRIGAIRHDVTAPCEKKCVMIMCADNGVVAEGVSQTDSSVTKIVADNLAKGISTVNLMSRPSNATVIPINIGMLDEPSQSGVWARCVRKGTGNIAKEAAMTEDECIRAILCGIEAVGYAKGNGFDIIATGEMGIGNTTTSSAIASVILDADPETVTGKGAGLSDEGLRRKIEVIRKAIALHNPDKNNPVELISSLGGLDIAGMTGMFIGGAVYELPIVIDGLISTISAILATKLNHDIIDYVIPSHGGREPACVMLEKFFDRKPYIYADMALGEGTGAVTLFPLIDIAKSVYSRNITFGDISMEPYRAL